MCDIYIDLNMVRAGVVAQPGKWPYGGYYDIHCRQRRSSIIDIDLLTSYLGFQKVPSFKKEYVKWITHALHSEISYRDRRWTESVAVGTKSFLEMVKQKLGIRDMPRKIESDTYEMEKAITKDYYSIGKNDFSWYTKT